MTSSPGSGFFYAQSEKEKTSAELVADKAEGSPAIDKKNVFPGVFLPLQETACQNIFAGQKFFMLAGGGILAAFLLASWHLTIVLLLGFLTLVYFLDVLFNLFLIYRSFARQPEISIAGKDLLLIPDSVWPRYTILCPLYKEWKVVPQFIKAISTLDYPKDRLQVLLLLEEDDVKTIQSVKAMVLPEYFGVVVVPDSLPKTKPKAMNYGFRYITGQYTVIYDAEDVPDPLQLKKAVLAFAKAPQGTVCAQAKLNFYNPRQDLLTKVFTAEYSLWFDLILPGLQSIDAPIPLGGTSNHFRTADLKALKGWDAYNVTEDCDLGIRLAKKGFKTVIFNSTTWEEANSKLGNWYRQRSRWIKGYMQTFLVHMRQWRMFVDNRKWRDLLLFQMTVGGKVLSYFINPLMWLMTIAYFAFRPTLGPLIESFFPWPVLYMGVFAFVFGNFLYLYLYMIGCAKRGFDGLVKYAFFVPFYWLLMSIAAWKALDELIFRPYYWAKTEHGLHLKKDERQRSWLPAFVPLGRIWNLARAKGAVSGGGMLVTAIVVSSFLNFLFNAVLGRTLSLEDFGVVTLFNTFTMILAIVTSALAMTVNRQTAFVAAKDSMVKGVDFRDTARSRILKVIIVLSLIWIVTLPVMMSFFHVASLALGLAFTPALAFGLLAAVDRGFMQGTQSFFFAGLVLLAESGTKLLAAMALLALGLRSWIVLSLPVSLAAAFLLAWYLAQRVIARAKVPSSVFPQHGLALSMRKAAALAGIFPRRFFAAAVLTGLSSVAFLTLDVILAKHFLSPAAAGQYALLSLAGKMVYYFGSLLSIFIVTFASRDEGAGKDPNPLFYKLLGWTSLLVILGWAGVGLWGRYFVVFLLGAKAAAIAPFLPVYATAMALFTLADTFVIFHLARWHLSFSVVSLLLTALTGLLVWRNSVSVPDIANAMLIGAAVYAGIIGLLHLLQRNGEFLIRNLVDLAGAFFPLPSATAAPGGQRILIFNWRDTRHAFAGGAEVYVHEMAKRWVKAGHMVTVFCGNDGKCLRSEVVDGVRVIRRGGFYFVYFWAFVYYLLHFRGRFDLIIDCQNGIPFFTPLYAKERVVCLMHHVHQEVFRRYLSPPLAHLASVLENRAMPWVYRRVKFITISDSSFRNMERLGLGKAGVEIIHPGVDLSYLRPGKKEAHPLVLYLGRLKAYKSVDVLIRAFKDVVAAMPTAELVIAGSGEEEASLEKLACDLGLGSRVSFRGKVTEQEKLSLLQRAWILVNPSLVEGWGITTIEANACGTPVVAANVPGLCDSVVNPHTGFLVKHGDVTGFSQRILLLLSDRGLRENMGSQAVEWARNFDWDETAQRSMEVLEKMR